METKRPDEIDVERLLGTLQPPQVPNEAFDRDNSDLYEIKTWKKRFGISVLAGLSTEPNFQANGLRIDWLQRLVIAHSDGGRKPGPEEISRALNAGLDRAKVLRLEDPIEELFCDLIPTRRGNYRIFTGLWENAAPFTRTLLDAFESLPDSSVKAEVLSCVYALLKLSDEIAERAAVNRFTKGDGTPNGLMTVPKASSLRKLARRVQFSDAELEHLGIHKDSISSFLIDDKLFRYVSDRAPGDTPLEFHPLLANPHGIIVVSPANISLAVRSLMVRVAQEGGMEKPLLLAMLSEQEKYANGTNFWPPRLVQLSPPDKHLLRVNISQFSPGRFLQVIQVPAMFQEFPQRGFASVRQLDNQANQAIADYVAIFWRILEKQPDYRESVTVLLLSGWGTPHSLSPPIEDGRAPRQWQYLTLSFADAAVLGACKNGKFRDVIRILQQVERLEREQFSFHYVNGITNLFGYWCATDGNLIPEHTKEIEPPCTISFAINELLAPRIEAANKCDVRALMLPDCTYKIVQRVDWDDLEDLRPVYASAEDAMQGRLLGAFYLDERTWWIEIAPSTRASRGWCYRVWHAVLEWLAATGPKLILQFPKSFPARSVKIDIQIPDDAAFDEIESPSAANTKLADTIVGNSSIVYVQREWLKYLSRPENDAEIELLGGILEQIALAEASIDREGLCAELIKLLPRDWRWMHAHKVLTPVQHLAAAKLIGEFQEIRLSAFSLAKCGSVWNFWPRSNGCEIKGENDCKQFLRLYRDNLLQYILSEIRQYDREELVSFVATHYQAARFEQPQWRGTIRALRAIHGRAADEHAFRRQNEANAVQRAAKSVCEMAACEAPTSEGKVPDEDSLQTMFATALLLFSNGNLFAAMRAGLIEPTLRISPAGDLLSERAVFEKTLRPGAELTHTRNLNDAADAYIRDREDRGTSNANSTMRIEESFRLAIETEYGVSAEAFVDLQYVLVQIAEEQNSSTFILKRSELAALLSANRQYGCQNPAPLLERLTLARRKSWTDFSNGIKESDIDISHFDRPFSLINRPLLAVDDGPDPRVMVCPVLVGDSAMYSLTGLWEGGLQNRFWTSEQARNYAGKRGHITGHEFEKLIASRLKVRGLQAWADCALSWVLNEKTDPVLGNIDVLAISQDRRRVWVIEAKNLRLCRTEAEIAARLSDYRGRMIQEKDRAKPDKMLRHIRRVEYLRERRHALSRRLSLEGTPDVKGLLIVDKPQPMNFHMFEHLEDGKSIFLDVLDDFAF